MLISNEIEMRRFSFRRNHLRVFAHGLLRRRIRACYMPRVGTRGYYILPLRGRRSNPGLAPQAHHILLNQ